MELKHPDMCCSEIQINVQQKSVCFEYIYLILSVSVIWHFSICTNVVQCIRKTPKMSLVGYA